MRELSTNYNQNVNENKEKLDNKNKEKMCDSNLRNNKIIKERNLFEKNIFKIEEVFQLIILEK